MQIGEEELWTLVAVMAPYDPFEIALDLSINDSGLHYVRGICVEHKINLHQFEQTGWFLASEHFLSWSF